MEAALVSGAASPQGRHTRKDAWPSSTAGHQGVSVCDVLASLSHRHEARIMWIAFGIAVLLHFGLMLLDFPDMKSVVQAEPKGNVILQAVIHGDGSVGDLKSGNDRFAK